MSEKQVVKLSVEDGKIKTKFESIETEVREDGGSKKLILALSLMNSDGEPIVSENFRVTWSLNTDDPVDYENDEKTKNLVSSLIKDQIKIDLDKCPIVENLISKILV